MHNAYLYIFRCLQKCLKVIIIYAFHEVCKIINISFSTWPSMILWCNITDNRMASPHKRRGRWVPLSHLENLLKWTWFVVLSKYVNQLIDLFSIVNIDMFLPWIIKFCEPRLMSHQGLIVNIPSRFTLWKRELSTPAPSRNSSLPTFSHNVYSWSPF